MVHCVKGSCHRIVSGYQHMILNTLDDVEQTKGTYYCTVVVVQKTQVDLAVQVYGWKIVERKYVKGETGYSGVAILNELH